MSFSLSTLAIVGHKGRMGALFATRLQQAGFTVRGVDLPTPTAHERAHNHAGEGPSSGLDPQACAKALDGADALLICVPVHAYEEVLALLKPLLDPSLLLMDTGSAKMLPMRWMEAAHQGPVVGTHPLFGPTPSAVDAPTLAVVPGAKALEAHVIAARHLFEAAGFGTFVTTAEAHDRAVAYVQCLNFLTSAAYFAAVPKSDEILPFLTPSFRRRLGEQKKLLIEDAPMFRAFTEANPMVGEALEQFRAALSQAEHGGSQAVAAQAARWYDEK